MYIALAVLVLVGAAGHVTFWAARVSRIHSLAIRPRWIKLATWLCGLAVAAIPLAIGALLWRLRQPDFEVGAVMQVTAAVAWCYILFCAIYGLICAYRHWQILRHPERRGAVVAIRTTPVDVRREVTGPLTAPGMHTWLSRLPGNQALKVQFHEEELRIERLPLPADGLRMVHLSDLHMSGRIQKDYFVHVVERVNAWEPDLVALTGDLIEYDQCIDWIPDTLGRLTAPGGVYFVLGNHDRRVDAQRLASALAETDMVHLGASWRQVTVRGTPLVLAGNELPWYKPAADLSDCPSRSADGLPLRVLLAHGPDQFSWAQDHDFDLMLAGHNHGGQVSLPLLGPVLAPSRSGVRYAAGVFRAGQTVMHVSRGTSSHSLLRWNCPPEAALLVLRPGA